MAQVNLDVVYNIKGMQALKQSQKAMDKAGKTASTGANGIKGLTVQLPALVLPRLLAPRGVKVHRCAERVSGSCWDNQRSRRVCRDR